jgi:adenylate cyclase
MSLPPRAVHAGIVGIFLLAGLLWGGYLAVGQVKALDRGFEHLEDLTADWRFAVLGPRPVPRGVVVVAIDDDTIQAAGHYPLPRDVLARIVRGVAAQGPQAIAIDLLFLEAGEASADAELADALRSARSVIGAVGLVGTPDRPAPVAVFDRLLWPTEVIRQAAQVGLVNVVTDRTGEVRYVPIVSQAPGTILPSFVLAASAAALGTDPVLGKDLVRLAGRTTTTDIGYHMPIRYYGPAGSIRHLSAAQVLRGELDPAAVRGQVVVIGVTAVGSGDTFATPFDRVVPGVEIMATAITNLLSGDGLVRSARIRWIDAAAAILLPVGVVLLLAITRPFAGTCLAVVLVVAWLALTIGAFASGYWLSIAVPLAALVPVAAGYGLVRLVVDRSQAQRFATEAAALARFQSPRLVGSIARNPGFLDKPVRQDVAVVFLDLSGFTGVSEGLGPEWTRELLANFHALIERHVSEQDGYIVSFMGDGAMVLFGLPVPRPDDAARAVNTMMRLDTAVSDWLQNLPPVARDRLGARIAGHFGPAVVSRLGSAQQQYVTASGDTVNVTSRLLEVAKERGARVIISEDLSAAAGSTGHREVESTARREVESTGHREVESTARREAGSIMAVAIRGRTEPLRVHLWH